MAAKRFVSVQDLRKDNEFFIADKLPCCLSAVGYVDNNWSDKEIVTAEILDIMAPRVAATHLNGRPVLFAHSGWLEDNRITRYKKLWRRLADAGVALPNGVRSEEVMRSRAHEILFSGFIELDNLTSNAIPRLLLDHSSFFFMHCDLDEIRNIFNLFSTSNTVDPRSGLLSQNGWLVEILCRGQAGIHQPYAWVDERYSGLVYIFNPEYLAY
ncbi:hypothetical protein [Methylosinus sp. LW4]|uniref:hypothetical protein n=1 Tax=Methylosinus sp. LW4 TaxID=136993 RepID=UPI0012FCC3BE|nr:hypothetical protein [Methylosinus sp. LW4]